MELLEQKSAAEDEDLPCRIERIISELNNQYARASKYGVPSDRIIKANHIRNGIIQGIYKPTISKLAMDILHPPKSPNKCYHDQDSIQMDLSLTSSTSLDGLDVTKLFPYEEEMNCRGSDSSFNDSDLEVSQSPPYEEEKDYESDNSFNTASNTSA